MALGKHTQRLFYSRPPMFTRFARIGDRASITSVTANCLSDSRSPFHGERFLQRIDKSDCRSRVDELVNPVEALRIANVSPE
jgi:hypothetical protein